MPTRLAQPLLAAAFLAVAACLAPTSALAATSEGGASTPQSGAPQSSAVTSGGVSPNDPEFQPTGKAKIVNGIAIPPADAPPEVAGMINAANSIAGMPYRYGGGHKTFVDTGYDCSGTVSYVLNGAGAGLLTAPLDSSAFMRWGVTGRGKWVTVYTNPGHAFIMIAGLRFDTGYRDNTVLGLLPGSGPRWGKKRSTRGYRARHPLGF